MKNSTTAACPKSADAPKHYILHHNQSMRAIASHHNSPNTLPSVTNITFDGPAGLVPPHGDTGRTGIDVAGMVQGSKFTAREAAKPAAALPTGARLI